MEVVATPENPADGIVPENITGSGVEPWMFKNAKNIVLRDIHLTGLRQNFLSLTNATGTGLDEANH